jgi:hypothetical protein
MAAVSAVAAATMAVADSPGRAGVAVALPGRAAAAVVPMAAGAADRMEGAAEAVAAAIIRTERPM